MIGRNILTILCLSIPFSLVNYSGYFMGHTPTLSQVVCSLMYSLIWFVYGCAIGFKYNTKIKFIWIAIVYWGVGFLLFIVSFYNKISIIYFPTAIVFFGPLYGLRYFLKAPSDMNFVILSSIIILGVGMSGYGIGKWLKRSVKQ